MQFEIAADALGSVLAWLERRGGTVDDFAFPSRVNPAGHLGARQYARLLDEWVTTIGLPPDEYGTHSLSFLWTAAWAEASRRGLRPKRQG